MAGDSKLARRRQNSTASGTSRSLGSKTPAEPKSAHVADAYLQDFLDPAFDAAEYLNKTLPPLQASSYPRSGTSLADLASEAQTTVTQLNAQTTRLTNTLTQLTDDIIRSGSRLAYEVELLRGEALSLSEVLTDGLHDDVVKFVPDGIQDGAVAVAGASADGAQGTRVNATTPVTAASAAVVPPRPTQEEPSYVTQLRTLTLVRSRLEAVIKTFGEAMEFVFPPSELSVSSSFLSVSAPDAGGDNHSTEEKGQQVLQALRDEISDLLAGGKAGAQDDAIRGIEDAAKRIEELKELNGVWKGTAEEKGRTRFMESLAKKVEERHRELLKEMEQASRRDVAKSEAVEASSKRSSGETEGAAGDNTKGYGGYNLISQLQKLRNGL